MAYKEKAGHTHWYGAFLAKAHACLVCLKLEEISTCLVCVSSRKFLIKLPIGFRQLDYEFEEWIRINSNQTQVVQWRCNPIYIYLNLEFKLKRFCWGYWYGSWVVTSWSIIEYVVGGWGGTERKRGAVGDVGEDEDKGCCQVKSSMFSGQCFGPLLTHICEGEWSRRRKNSSLNVVMPFYYI